MPADHVAAEGECCSSLAAKNNLADYRRIHDAPDNAALKGSRPNPNQLVAGDKLKIPDRDPKKFPAETGTTQKFVLAKSATHLRVQLADASDKAILAKTWTLTVGSQKKSGTGFIDLPIDPQETAATLQLDLAKPASAPAPAPPAPPAPAVPPYPPPLVEAAFTDTLDAAFVGGDADSGKIEWTLAIGSLPSFNNVAGVQERLRNLGFVCKGAPGDAADPQTQAAVKAFQKAAKLAETGAAKDIEAAVRDRHDKKR